MKLALNSQLQTYQILTNDVQVVILCLSYFITSVNSNPGKSMSFSPKVRRIIAFLGKEKNDEALFPTLWCFEFTHCTGNQHFRECTKARNFCKIFSLIPSKKPVTCH